jgi:hypothetical protein
MTAAAIILFVLLGFTQTASAAVTLGDGGFEMNSPNPYWTEKSTLGYTLIVAGSAHTGTYRVYLGGTGGSGEVSTISQTFKMPKNGTASLVFWLRIPAYDVTGSDKLQVIVDGDKLFTVPETDGPSYSSYQPIVLDLSAYLDGGTHTLKIKGTDKSGADTSWSIDDVAIQFDGIVNGSMEIDANGDNVPDGWKIKSPSGSTQRICGVSYSGACSARLQGDTGSQEQLIYTYKAGPTGIAGDTFTLWLRGYASGFTAFGQWGMTVEAYNTDGTVSTLSNEGFTANTGGVWGLGAVILTAPKDYKKIKITIWHLGNSPGVAYLDYFLMPATGGPVPAPLLPDGPTLTGE